MLVYLWCSVCISLKQCDILLYLARYNLIIGKANSCHTKPATCFSTSFSSVLPSQLTNSWNKDCWIPFPHISTERWSHILRPSMGNLFIYQEALPCPYGGLCNDYQCRWKPSKAGEQDGDIPFELVVIDWMFTWWSCREMLKYLHQIWMWSLWIVHFSCVLWGWSVHGWLCICRVCIHFRCLNLF